MSQRLRVLLVTDWMPRPGGAEAYADSIRAGLTAAGDNVRLLTSGAGSAAHGTADFVAYGTTRRAAQVGLQIVNPFATHQAWAAVRSFQPDVALVHLFAYHLSPAVMWPLRSIPTVMMVLDYKIICPLGSKLLPTGEICDAARRHDLLACRLPLTAALGPRLDSLCWHWTRHSSVTPRARMQSAHATQARGARYRIRAARSARCWSGTCLQRKPSRDPHFVFCGRLSVEKGVPLLVRAFARLHAHMPLARLTIVGDGPLRNEVESAVLARDLHDAVTFTGWLDPAGVDRQLETAWALVAPSVWAEPLGMVGPEAVIRSVPVIASSIRRIRRNHRGRGFWSPLSKRRRARAASRARASRNRHGIPVALVGSRRLSLA